MKIQLLVNLKINDGRVIRAGKVLDENIEPFPEYATNNIDNANIFKILDATKIGEIEPSPILLTLSKKLKIPAKKR